MKKVSGLDSITAPGPVIENLAVDAGYERSKRSKSVQKVDREKVRGVHPLVEVAMRNKIAFALDPSAVPEVKQEIPPVSNELSTNFHQKTPLESLPIDRLSALSRKSDSGVGVTMSNDQANATGKGGDAAGRSGYSYRSNRRAISSPQPQSKLAAFARAELLAALYPYRLSKTASEAIGSVLLKAAAQGVGNFPEAGQQAIMRKAIPERGAGGTKQVDGTANLAKRGPAVKNLANTSNHIGSMLGTTGLGTTGSAARASAFTTEPGSLPFGGSTDEKVSLAEFRPMNKAAALVRLVKSGLRKTAVLDFLRVSQDKKAALLTIGRLQKASEQERAMAKLAGLMRTYELANSDGKGAMPSGPEGPVPDVLTGSKTQFASDWCNRLDPLSRKVPLARVMGRRKGNL